MSGHNRRGVSMPAETRAKIAAAQSGEKSRLHGKKPHNFKGRIVNPYGYVLIHMPDHPFRNRTLKKVLEHRLVMESHLRATDPKSDYLVEVDGEMYLRPGVEVHHLNEVKDDNRIENLEVMTRSEHAKSHRSGAKYQLAKTHCPHGHPYDEANTIHSRGQRFCRECRNVTARESYRRKNG